MTTPIPVPAAVGNPHSTPRNPDRWMTDALCADEALYLPWTIDHWLLDRAELVAMRHVCARCPVKNACGDYADRNRIDGGTWAGEPRARRYEQDTLPGLEVAA